jgi:hypothetical protein
MPYWLLAQADTHRAAAKVAEETFKAMFNQTKQPEAICFARDEILNVFFLA